ncbi:autophagy protein 5 [Kwoniella heveanensis CBS 569]|nr:autophagy protein 5 [Kwoniella heveanensis CBS 569]
MSNINSTNPIHSSTNLFRRLAWQSSVSISIRIADGEPGSGAGVGADRYFLQVPRYTYLPLLIQEIRENFVELALNDAELETVDETTWWFEEERDEDEAPGAFAGQGTCRWHWPIDLIDLHSYISRPRPLPAASGSSSSSSSSTSNPPISHIPKRRLNLILHLSNPPTDRLLMPNNVETCKTQWLNQVKEADFVRWRNTNRVTNLRRTDLEAGWDGIVQDDYDLYLRMASRVLPLPTPVAGLSTNTGSSMNPARSPSTDPGSGAGSGSGSGSSIKSESSYAVRSVPLKIYLPDNAPVIQEVIPPTKPDGKPATLLSILRKHLPLLFPPNPPNLTSAASIRNMSQSFHSTLTLNQSRSRTDLKATNAQPAIDPYTLAFPVAQGILIPPEADLAWLSSCISGADGWIRIGICIRAY